jgi:uncharacterized protein YjbJ (UPF0337 family)
MEEESTMDKDEVKGKFEQGKGYIKEKIGEATNDPDTEAEGAKERAKGKVREAYGEAKDKVKRAADEITE